MFSTLPTNPTMKLKQQLASLMEKHDVTVVQLSRKTSVPRNTIFNWLSGMKPKDVEQVKRCADVFGVSLDFILFGIELKASRTVLEDRLNEINAGHFEVILKPVKR